MRGGDGGLENNLNCWRADELKLGGGVKVTVCNLFQFGVIVVKQGVRGIQIVDNGG